MASSSATPSAAKVVALPSMTHSLSRLPHMPSVDPRCLHYGALGASKEASQAKLQQTLQRRDAAAYASQTPPYPAPPRKPQGTDDGDFLMMNKSRKKPA